MRYELQALIKLKVKYGIENPYVAYAFYKLENLERISDLAILEPEQMYSRKALLILSILINEKLAGITL